MTPTDPIALTFLGAAGTVTGSRYLLARGGRHLLVDCGLFQGLKRLRLRNREPFPLAPDRIEAVILTHAHLDHSGYLPVLVREGFRGPVYCTPATAELCGILLPDSGRLQEEEAEYANRRGHTRHHPALPLYTEAEALAALERLVPVRLGGRHELGGDHSFTLRQAGHLLGAASVQVELGGTRILFSGDLGRPADPLLPPPEGGGRADFLVVESTYGDRLHERSDPSAELERHIVAAARRGGSVLIPSFAVGRAQHLLVLLHRLRRERRIPPLPVYLDSPMAGRATEAFLRHPEGLKLSRRELEEAFAVAVPTPSVEESKAIHRSSVPRVIISASGMATGGRVLHHLVAMLGDPRHCVLFAGYQAAGTRGASLLGGAEAIKIHGSYVPVRAELAQLDALSGHADHGEILAWLRGFEAPPRTTFVTHGEPAAADALRRRIEEALRWRVAVPEHGDAVLLPGPEAPAQHSSSTPVSAPTGTG